MLRLIYEDKLDAVLELVDDSSDNDEDNYITFLNNDTRQLINDIIGIKNI